MTGVSLRIQAVLYNEDVAALMRSAASIGAAVRYWSDASNELPRITLAYGDASPAPLLSDDDRSRIAHAVGKGVQVEYRVFGENTGYGKGHNLLAQNAEQDFILFMNPDVVLAPPCLQRLTATMTCDDSMGAVEARQTPIENARWFNPETGETDWAAGACLLVRRQAFEQCGGFDCDTFFMYCEDVDFSWAVRHAGFRVACQPAAVAFHPHRLSQTGIWEPSVNERYHDALGKLLLARKWGADETLRRIIAAFAWNDDPEYRRAASDFRKLAKQDPGKRIANGTASSSFHGIEHTLYRRIAQLDEARGETPRPKEAFAPDLAYKTAEAPVATDAPSPFLSAIVPVGSDCSEELIELLTCLAAQDCDDFEAWLVPRGENELPPTDIGGIVGLMPYDVQGKLHIVNDSNATLQDVCQSANGLYASLLPCDHLISDDWVSTFMRAAATSPGSVVRCHASRQVWARQKAPVIGGLTLMSAEPINPAFCGELDPNRLGESEPIPTSSWAFPLFAVKDLGLAPDDLASNDDRWRFFEALCSTCELAQTAETTVIAREWTDLPVVPTGDPQPKSGIRQALSPEVEEALRFARRRLAHARL